ncbi:hypothetical protein VCRA2123O443_10097 [Vibrio crassostreae]|nr:hypothetical protein VCRA2113O420_320043 [Vibrio crassostreae]CAK3141133.1 hypothetical protein VCRA2123O443_10097 [Vibrio crassostreae]
MAVWRCKAILKLRATRFGEMYQGHLICRVEGLLERERFWESQVFNGVNFTILSREMSFHTESAKSSKSS